MQALELSCQDNWKDGQLDDTRLYAWEARVKGGDWGRAAIAARKLELLRPKLRQMGAREGRCKRFSLYLMRAERALALAVHTLWVTPSVRRGDAFGGWKLSWCG